MSRSYKKTPYCGDRKGKAKKRAANGHIRQLLKRDPELNIDHGGHKRHYEQYEICDYGDLCTWEEYWNAEMRAYEKMKRMYPDDPNVKPPCKKEAYRDWIKFYRSK